MESSMGVDYMNCDWFKDLISQTSVCDTKLSHDRSMHRENNYLNDNSTQRFLERYFDTLYLIDVGNIPNNDYCLLKHSNSVCVVGLACGHFIFHNCENEFTVHSIVGLDYQITEDLNRLDSHVKGRNKSGGQFLRHSTDKLAYAVCDRGIKHPLLCGIPGKLLEVNQNIIYKPDQLFEIKPLGGTALAKDNKNLSNGTYLSIIKPSNIFLRLLYENLNDNDNDRFTIVLPNSRCKYEFLKWSEYSKLRNFNL